MIELQSDPVHVVTWDFNLYLGKTIKERYEALFIVMGEVNDLMGGFDSILTSPEVSCMIEISSSNFDPDRYEPSEEFVGYMDCGKMMNRWRLFKSPSAVYDKMILLRLDEGKQVYSIVNLLNYTI